MNTKIFSIIILLFSSNVLSQSEDYYNNKFCEEIGGQRETIHRYEYGPEKTYAGRSSSYIMVDCETTTYVWEGGMDTRSSLDSIQQALFASAITGKLPGVVIYDKDNIRGTYEHRIKQLVRRQELNFNVTAKLSSSMVAFLEGLY